MSKSLQLSSALPGDERINGLDSLAPDLTLDSVVVALVWFDVPQIAVSKDGHRPQLRMRKVEPFGSPTEVPQEVVAAALLAEERRTNSTPLPFGSLAAPDPADRERLQDDCDHVDVHVEGDEIEGVPEGMVREVCLRCGHVQYTPDDAERDDDDAPESGEGE